LRAMTIIVIMKYLKSKLVLIFPRQKRWKIIHFSIQSNLVLVIWYYV
jgi:hypothetical protein